MEVMVIGLNGRNVVKAVEVEFPIVTGHVTAPSLKEMEKTVLDWEILPSQSHVNKNLVLKVRCSEV